MTKTKMLQQRFSRAGALLAAASLTLSLATPQRVQAFDSQKMDSDRTPVVVPALEAPGPRASAPSDALILFDGQDLSQLRRSSTRAVRTSSMT